MYWVPEQELHITFDCILWTKSIHGWVSVDPQHLDQHSIKISIYTWSTLDQHFGWHSFESWLPTIVDRVLFNCQSRCQSSVSLVSTGYWSRCWSSVDWDVYEVMTEGWSRVLIAMRRQMPLTHIIILLILLMQVQVTCVDKTLSMIRYSHNQINQSVNWSVSQWVSQSINQSVSQ